MVSLDRAKEILNAKIIMEENMTDSPETFDRSIIVKVLTQNENQWGIWYGVEDALGNRYSAFKGAAQKIVDDQLQEGERIRIQGVITRKGEKRYYNINAFEREIGVNDDMEKEEAEEEGASKILESHQDTAMRRGALTHGITGNILQAMATQGLLADTAEGVAEQAVVILSALELWYTR